MKKIGCIVFLITLFTDICWAENNGQTFTSVTIMSADQTKIKCAYNLETANTKEKLRQGLMGRNHLDKHAGMLLDTQILPLDTVIAIWMKNTLIPLDILFVDQHNVIFDQHKQAMPFDETPIIASKRPAYVVEINAGQIDSCRIQKGDIIVKSH